MKLLLDEHFSTLIAEQLRKRGHTVWAVSEMPDLEGLSDENVVKLAVEKKCAVVTNNVRDFKPIMQQLIASGRSHFGLICVPSNRPRTKAATGSIVRSLEQLLQQYEKPNELKNRELWLPVENDR